ncbi:bifunctional hydroxymethylpyrimidine kinase/phosphomethylpyrimidine kinase [Bacillus sp. FJAT-27251]|uniref:bifunctional hydroxymethylpyrimidine kinase/phosphomethylpyrimidine kinase n=1 Tax=Bacillus sp. FJAT-27251 TaxID=1684142 RepID=UPI0006A77C43|nr:bifunctional hydroxymethylpyrimidine kinase/phosphomethylpyrimidine kinase [Bacillus sp. FJAT-27251]
MKVYKSLTIAGSDSGGGAGIQADLKTFQELGVFGTSALTAVTAQNTMGVQDVFPLNPDQVVKQIHSVGSDLKIDSLKTGMLFSAEIITAVARMIREFKWEKLVVDPVMIAKGGASLLQQQAVVALKQELLPLAMVLTPNIPEAEVLTGISIKSEEDKKEAARRLHGMGVKYVLIKGGHEEDRHQAIDLLFDGNAFSTLQSRRIATKNTHGTGCTFSAAITAELAKGASIHEAAATAKTFIQAAIEEDLNIGSGHGPTNHWAYNQNMKLNR